MFRRLSVDAESTIGENGVEGCCVPHAGTPGVALDDLVYIMTRLARQMEEDGFDKVWAGREEVEGRCGKHVGSRTAMTGVKWLDKGGTYLVGLWQDRGRRF